MRLANRIVSSGHDTVLVEEGRVSERLIAYHRERARGGCGLIVVQVAAVHESARYTAHVLDATSDACVAGYRDLAAALHTEGTAVVGQLFHPGREVIESLDGTAPVPVAPSAVPTERFARTPRALATDEVAEIVAGYGAAAARLVGAGLDGVEVVASHGYLPAQFLAAHTNRRQDRYGGSVENRWRFLDEVLGSVRAASGEAVVGLRLCLDERDPAGLEPEEMWAYLAHLSPGLVDYLSLTTGSSATRGGATHIVPDMSHPNAYLAGAAAELRRRTGAVVMVAGRINQPQEAERLVAEGAADAVVMTRALISDPEMPAKARRGDLEGIRACVGCNQACIGHFHAGFAISCIQHPETGRETTWVPVRRTRRGRRVLVIGGGPGGLKAAAALAERGHVVELHEVAERVGGQVHLAASLPGREEFAGVAQNLAREAQRAGARVVTRSVIDAAGLGERAPEFVVVATGSRPRRPAIEVVGAPRLLSEDEALGASFERGARVLVADVFAQWAGAGIARALARRGCRVTLALCARGAGEGLQSYLRDQQIVELARDRVTVATNTRLVGADEDTAYCQDVLTDEVSLVEADAIVHVTGREPALPTNLLAALADLPHALIGDALAPRTVEEAVYEGLRVAGDPRLA